MWQNVAKFKGAEYFRKALYIALRTSADISKCCTETQLKTPNSKQCRCRTTVSRKKYKKET